MLPKVWECLCATQRAVRLQKHRALQSSAMWWAGLFCLFYHCLSRGVGNRRKDHKKQPGAVSEVNNLKGNPFTAINTAAKISKPCPGDRQDPSKNFKSCTWFVCLFGLKKEKAKNIKKKERGKKGRRSLRAFCPLLAAPQRQKCDFMFTKSQLSP